MKYVKNKNLGYDESQTVVIKIDNNDIYEHRNMFKNELQNHPNIQSVSLMSGEPGGFFDMFGFRVEGKNDEALKFRTEFADFEFVKTLGLKIIAGRDFSPSFPTDTAKGCTHQPDGCFIAGMDAGAGDRKMDSEFHAG